MLATLDALGSGESSILGEVKLTPRLADQLTELSGMLGEFSEIKEMVAEEKGMKQTYTCPNCGRTDVPADSVDAHTNPTANPQKTKKPN